MKVLNVLLMLFFVNVLAQKTTPKIETVKINDKIYVLKGIGGNVGIFVGSEEVFMIDDKFANVTPQILAAVKKITPKPVSYLINTHWHGDHTGGNENMHKQGAVIISHENVRLRMNSENTVRGKVKPPAPKGALPVITFEKDIMFHLDGEDILAYHVHNAHTDGDAHIFFTNSNVIHMGDTYFQGKFPYIDLDSGGSIDGYIESANKVIRLADDDTVIIPGHMNVSNKKELIEFRDMLVDLRDKISHEIEVGKGLEDVKNDTSLTKDYEKQYNWNFINAEKIRITIYNSLLNN